MTWAQFWALSTASTMDAETARLLRRASQRQGKEGSR